MKALRGLMATLAGVMSLATVVWIVTHGLRP